DDDAAGADGLAAVHLDPQTLAVGFATVAGGTLTFLVSHVISPQESSQVAWMSCRPGVSPSAFLRAFPPAFPAPSGRRCPPPAGSGWRPGRPIRRAARTGSRRNAGSSGRPAA